MADPVEVAERYDEAFNARDAGVRRAIEAPDVEVVMPGGITLKGPDQVFRAVGAFWEALPDGKIVVESQHAAGDVVVQEGRLVGTHTGSFRSPAGDIPPTGKAVNLRYAAVKRITEGRLTSEHLYFDQLEFLEQLGVMGD